MKPKSLFVLLFSVLVGSSYAAIDLTPAVTDHVEDGVMSRNASFKTPEGNVLVTLSPDWTIRGQKDRAQITGADKSMDAVIEAAPLQKPEPLDEATMTKFKQQVVAGSPVGSTKVTIVSEAQNSIMPGSNPSFEVVVTYDLWGKAFQRSVLLVNAPQDRFVIRFTALKQDFEALNTEFRRMLMTWRAIATKQAPKTAVAQSEAPSSQAN